MAHARHRWSGRAPGTSERDWNRASEEELDRAIQLVRERMIAEHEEEDRQRRREDLWPGLRRNVGALIITGVAMTLAVVCIQTWLWIGSRFPVSDLLGVALLTAFAAAWMRAFYLRHRRRP